MLQRVNVSFSEFNWKVLISQRTRLVLRCPVLEEEVFLVFLLLMDVTLTDDGIKPSFGFSRDDPVKVIVAVGNVASEVGDGSAGKNSLSVISYQLLVIICLRSRVLEDPMWVGADYN